MSRFLEALSASALLADGAMGSYLFERTGRLSEANHVYETFNCDKPELIREIHLAYLRAGARCLTTNTFGANRTHLAPFGLDTQVEPLNRAGVHLAREAITAFADQTRADDPGFVLGSVGPTLEGRETPQELREIYREQIGALLDAGVDALLLETFNSLLHVVAVLEVAQEFNHRPPLIAQMSLHQAVTASGWDQDPVAFVKTAADMGVHVVGVNCCAPWEAVAFLDAVQEVDAVSDGRLQLAAMPNAGGFQRIGHRFMTRVKPEYMGGLARTFGERGVRLVGGCCEVHPLHIGEMHNYLHGRRTIIRTVEAASLPAGEPVSSQTKKANGPFSRKILEGEFAVSVEMLPARGTAPKRLQSKVDFVAELDRSGLADSLDVTDGSRGIPLMPPGDFIAVLRERLGWDAETGDALELIPHFTTRDLNVMGLQTRLIGYWARHIHNVLIITGDPPKMSPTYPRSTAVFDMDSVELIRCIHAGLNSGMDFGGQPLGRHDDPRTRFTIGSGFEPEAVDLERELEKLRQKIDCGADYIMTQPAFRGEPLHALTPFRSEIAIVVGVMILTGLDHARRVAQIPGVMIPDEIYDRLAVYEPVEDQAKVGREIAAEQAHGVREGGWAGLYLMSPSSLEPVTEVLREGLS